jgi:hypothetical protein
MADDSVSIMDWSLSFGFAALETAVFARLLLKPLLAERNEVLAQSILDQCKIYAGKGARKEPVKFVPSFDFFGLLARTGGTAPAATASTISSTIIYAPGSPPIDTNDINNSSNKVVVAVLGMAHCNGIKRILCESTLSAKS